MTIRQLHTRSPNRSRSLPESVFEAHDGADLVLVCMTDVDDWFESKSFQRTWPDFSDWTVTKEHFTQAELDERQPAK